MIRAGANCVQQIAAAAFTAKPEVAVASKREKGHGHAAEKAKMKGQSGFQSGGVEGNREGSGKYLQRLGITRTSPIGIAQHARMHAVPS